MVTPFFQHNASGNWKQYPALSTQFSLQKRASHVKVPLCLMKKFDISVENPLEGCIVKDVINFNLALPFSLDIVSAQNALQNLLELNLAEWLAERKCEK